MVLSLQNNLLAQGCRKLEVNFCEMYAYTCFSVSVSRKYIIKPIQVSKVCTCGICVHVYLILNKAKRGYKVNYE